jgi:glutathione S-transferase
MLLIGMLDSPFVRRVAVSMRLRGLSYEHGNWSVGRDFERIRQYSPLGRVPTLVLDDGTVLVESAAILDYLDDNAGDDQAGATRALLPEHGVARRDCLQLMALAIGAAETARDSIYEQLMRPAEKLHQPWLDRRLSQMHAALAQLEQRATARTNSEWLLGEKLTQADITVACCFTFMSEAVPLAADAPYPALRARVLRMEQRPEFVATKAVWFAPGKS